MAVPLSPDIQQDDDLQKFALAQSYFTMTESAAWKDVSELMDALVLQAQEDMFKSRKTEPLDIMEEKARWQQRMLMKQGILNRVQSQLDVREEIMQDMNGESDE